jgi:hypothetical protein
VHPRYIAFKFFKEISAIILSAEMQLRIEQENERRLKNGMKKLDKTLETSEELGFVYENKLQPTGQEKLMELLPKIILGVEREWGMDQIAYKPREDRVKWEDVMAIVNRPTNGESKALPTEEKVETKEDDDPLKGVMTSADI